MSFDSMLLEITKQGLIVWEIKEREEWCGKMRATTLQTIIPRSGIMVTARMHLRSWQDPQFSLEIADGGEKMIIASSRRLAKSLRGIYDRVCPIMSLFFTIENYAMVLEKRNGESTLEQRLNRGLHNTLYRKE